MNFQPELAAAVVRGEKTVTRRLVSENPRSPWWRERCGLVVGRDYAVCPGRGTNAVGRIVVTAVDLVSLGWLDDAESRAEGFADAHEFVGAFMAINRGKYNPSALVWRVEFELMETHDG